MERSFSISRKGYNPAEVDDYVNAAERSYNDLRENYATLQSKYDSLFEENGTLIKEREELRQNCVTMAAALNQLREKPGEDYKARYEEAVAQLEKYKAEIEELKAEKSAAPAGVDTMSASQMIEEVAMVVKRVESDARRKAEAITANAKIEQTQALLIRSRVNEEVKSLVQLLEGFLGNIQTEEETEE